MREQEDSPPTPLGIYDRGQQDRITSIEVVALTLSVLWLGGAAVFFLVLVPGNAEGGVTSEGVVRFVGIMLAVFMPVAMIWVAAIAARTARVMREESNRLQTAIDAVRQSYVAGVQNRNAAEPSVSRKLDEIAAAQRKTESALAIFSSTRQPPPARAARPAAEAAPAAGDDQVALPLGTEAEDIAPPVDRADFIRALNFPDTVDDKEGFAALRRALKDRETARLIQAAQDILTLMSQDGIYMDDLRPDLARPEVWRRFAAGERGRAIAGLGGIRDRSSLALTNARMKRDAIYRDAAHHFLRRFDKMVTQFVETASDAEITELSDTRTARAFMLLGRVAGTFD
ncbi:hypothetical protein [Roseovarius salinarum]|uniref:hypothetical protein n=1 Tax=Roseovarius salinarum TaxID=1981892 RepID=UPI000C32D6A0|nr:hypothetical protein [Roseovarius salinarum]